MKGIILASVRRDEADQPTIAPLLAPPQITNRFYSMFDAKDPTSVDRVTMLRVGARMIQAHPLAGVGPKKMQKAWPGGQ